MGLLDGKVAAVTDSGGGMGRAVALWMAREGARVVVNDSGDSDARGGGESSTAEEVVQEIQDRGGYAVAHSARLDSWEGSQSLVQTGLDRFGSVDILVNHKRDSAVLQGPMIFETSREMWQSALRNYLKAAFFCTRAVLPHMRKQRQGRLIHFISAEAFFGQRGHTHSGAVQAAVAGLSRNVAIEMERFCVTSNCIVPIPFVGRSRNTPSGNERDWNSPGRSTERMPTDVAPLTVFLASDLAQNLSGQVFGVWGNEILLFSQARIERSIHDSRGWTVERLCGTLEAAMRPHFTSMEPSDSYFCWDST